jgi:threonine dehydrogenase-like Zn-dependent dehydrogenase
VLVQQPLILGHEFGGVVEAVGPEAFDGHVEPLPPGMRVAVDPAQPCHRCPMCEQGNPSHRFALPQTPEAFALNTSYGDHVVKMVIDHTA